MLIKLDPKPNDLIMSKLNFIHLFVINIINRWLLLYIKGGLHPHLWQKMGMTYG